MRKKILIGIGIVVAVAVGATVALHFMVDASSFRKVVEARASNALGRPVSVGDLRFSILPVLGLQADDVTVAGRPGESTGTMLSLKRARIGARLLPLLRGRLEVTRIVLVEPSVNLARDAAGEWNFQLPGTTGTGSAGGGPGLTIDHLRIVRGLVRVRVASRSAAPLEATLDDLDLEVAGLGGAATEVKVTSGRLAVSDPALGAAPLVVSIAAARLTVHGAGKDIELSRLELAAAHTTVTMSGRLQEEARGRRVDLELKPTHITAADLGALLSRLSGDPTLSLSGPPISVEGGLHGPLAPGRLPEPQARATLDGLTLHAAALTRPITDLHAVATFDGARLAVEQLGARAGASDIAGSLRLDLQASPALHFDLRSKHADLDELMGLLATKEGTQSASHQKSFAANAVADGTLAVAEGSLANLDFQDLSARLHIEHGTATLDPVTVKLYGGHYRGRLESDLAHSPQTFQASGSMDGVEVGPFLAAATGTHDLLAGRARGRFSARGAGADPQAILADLQGQGTAEIVNGRIGGLDILSEVGKVAGVLGQQTLAKVAGGPTQSATRFSRLGTDFTVAHGQLQLDRVALVSPTFDLTGSGTVDLASSELEGRFQIAFSSQVSGWMKQEGTRAASLFWDQSSGRVTLPVQLDGPLDHPGATVDWGATVRDLARRPVQRELGNLLGDLLGKSSNNGTGGGPPPTPGTSSASASPNSEATPRASRSSGAAAQSPSGKLALEVAGTEWGGSFLARDFTIRLEVRGATAERVVMKAVDAAGREVQERTVDLAGRMAGGATSLELRVDGKRLLVAAKPVTVTITATGGGESAALTLQVPASGG